MSDARRLDVDWVVVGLGANLGNPEQAFRQAVRALRQNFEVAAGSRLYSGPAMRLPGSGPQPDYVNGALLLRRLPALVTEVVSRLLEVENQLGRVRTEQWGPRVLDLDLLLAGDHISEEPEALVPHPGLTSRAFALRPLLELVPLACDPRSGESYRATLDRLGPDGLRVVGGTEWACAT
jgi:2-amino-4-hydroxy-6-hydroxymethyldihydropteridine diphosphokinase